MDQTVFPSRRVLLLSLLAASCVGACSKPPPATFDLTAASHPSGVGSIAQTAVAEPSATALIDSDRLVVRSPGNQVAYLPGAQWADRLPKLFQAKLVQTFENATKSSSVSAPGGRIAARYQLNTDIRTFEVQADTREAVVEVTVRIVNDATGSIGAARIFTSRAPVAEIAGPAAAVALDQASQQVMLQIARWAATRS